MADAVKANVKVRPCENTLRGQKLTRDDMLPAISYQLWAGRRDRDNEAAK